MPPRQRQIFINGRFLGQRVTGVQRYAGETLHALDELLAAQDDSDLRWTVLVPRGTPQPTYRYLRGNPQRQAQAQSELMELKKKRRRAPTSC